jgi:DUF1365 family protein
MPAALFARLDDAATAIAGRATPSSARHAVPTLALIHGAITHRRHRPKENNFTYPAFCLRLPLSELASLPARGIAHNTAGLVSFHDRDHGACDGTALDSWIRTLLATEGIDGSGEVVLYAFPRMLGYVFNPVCFWVCHDDAGAVRAVLCEVRNTFGQRHNYLVAAPDNGVLVSGATCVTRKVFHVSPFCEVKGDYRFRFSFGTERWLARIDHFDDADLAEPLLETWISGEAAPVDPAAVRRLWWRYRFFTVGVVARIHWQALKLALKRVPYFTKPAPSPRETTR